MIPCLRFITRILYIWKVIIGKTTMWDCGWSINVCHKLSVNSNYMLFFVKLQQRKFYLFDEFQKKSHSLVYNFITSTSFYFNIRTGFKIIPRFVTGSWRGSLGESFVSTDCWVRVFWFSALIDRPYYRMYVSTIFLSGCVDRCSRCISFSYQSLLACHRKTCTLAASPE